MILSIYHEDTECYSVLLDGFPVTDRCFLADDENGIVYLFKKKEVNGKSFVLINNLGPIVEMRRGVVTIFKDGVPAADLDAGEEH